jgi:hypothetical protein
MRGSRRPLSQTFGKFQVKEASGATDSRAISAALPRAASVAVRKFALRVPRQVIDVRFAAQERSRAKWTAVLRQENASQQQHRASARFLSDAKRPWIYSSRKIREAAFLLGRPAANPDNDRSGKPWFLVAWRSGIISRTVRANDPI